MLRKGQPQNSWNRIDYQCSENNSNNNNNNSPVYWFCMSPCSVFQLTTAAKKQQEKSEPKNTHRRLKRTLIFIPAPVAQWLARRTVGRKVWGSNPIRVMWDFSALAGSYPELGVLWAQWEGWNHTAELHPLNGCVFEGVALIIWPTLQVPQFPGLVNTGIIVTVSVVYGPVK